MAVEQHPQYPAWSETLDRLVEAERRYQKRTENEIQQAARILDQARTRYQAIADQIE